MASSGVNIRQTNQGHFNFRQGSPILLPASDAKGELTRIEKVYKTTSEVKVANTLYISNESSLCEESQISSPQSPTSQTNLTTDEGLEIISNDVTSFTTTSSIDFNNVSVGGDLPESSDIPLTFNENLFNISFIINQEQSGIDDNDDEANNGRADITQDAKGELTRIEKVYKTTSEVKVANTLYISNESSLCEESQISSPQSPTSQTNLTTDEGLEIISNDVTSFTTTSSIDFNNVSVGGDLPESSDIPLTFNENLFNISFIINQEQSGIDDNDDEANNGRADITQVDDSLADRDYQPTESDLSDFNNEISKISNNTQEDRMLQDRSTRGSTQNSSIESFNISAANNNFPACDDGFMRVEISRGASGDKKFNVCYFCHKKQQKIARHLETKHKDQGEVKKFIFLPKGSSERRTIINSLRAKGNYIFNTNKELNDGELIVSRRPNAKHNRTARDFKACGICKAFFSQRSLRAHFAVCSGKSSKTNRIVMLMSKRAMRRVHSCASDVVRDQLFPKLQDDDIVRLVRFDELIIIFSNKMCEKYRDPRHHDMIRAKIRLLGRFLSLVKEINSKITDFASIYDPEFIDDTLKAINKIGNLNSKTNCFTSPSVPFHVGSLLKHVGYILINELIKKHQQDKRTNVEDFLKLLDMDVAVSINRRVTESQVVQKRKTSIKLPSKEDIKKLHFYLTKKREEAACKLMSSFTLEIWTELAETTLVSIQLFNRRRAGEIERTLITDFQKYQMVDENTDKDIFLSLSKESKEIAQKYARFLITGKLYRTVPVLLDNYLLKCIKLILKYRNNAKVPEVNPYVFGIKGRKGENKYLRACVLMRKFAVACGADNPERLRGTTLRKHIATTCISLNLNEVEIKDLADFMGHKSDIHKNIYRQPVLHRDVFNITKLLEVAQGGDDGDDSDDEKSDESFNERCHINDSKVPKKRSTSPYGPVKRRKWSEQEKCAVINEFKKKIKSKKLPSLQEAQIAIKNHPSLKGRTAPQLITWIHNHYKANKNLLSS
ncbi:hypothetical protein FQR65_LT18374 [Abscondita terminalis]|nr:hypothetical protein FQR65_LT18374 [Abscondita terminalis]